MTDLATGGAVTAGVIAVLHAVRLLWREIKSNPVAEQSQLGLNGESGKLSPSYWKNEMRKMLNDEAREHRERLMQAINRIEQRIDSLERRRDWK